MSDSSSFLGSLASGVAQTALRQAQAKVPLTLASMVNDGSANTTGSSLAAAAGAAASSSAAASTNAAASAASSSTSDSDAQTAKIKSTSEQFEAIFMRQMLSEARKTKLDDEDDDGGGMSTFTSMQDSHYADVASQSDTLGIAKMLEKTLSHRMGLDATGSATGATAAVSSAGAGTSASSGTSSISGTAATKA